MLAKTAVPSFFPSVMSDRNRLIARKPVRHSVGCKTWDNSNQNSQVQKETPATFESLKHNGPEHSEDGRHGHGGAGGDARGDAR